jgi:hypothetical protein
VVEAVEPDLSSTTTQGTKKQTWFEVKMEHQTLEAEAEAALQSQALAQEITTETQ